MISETELLLAGVIVSAFAAAVSAWMAVETRRMSAVAARTLELERQPILGFRDLRVEVVSRPTGIASGSGEPILALTSVRVGLELFNAGRVPILYEMDSITVAVGGQSKTNGRFVSRGGRVLPGSSVVFWHLGTILDPPLTSFPAKGEVRFSFAYRGEADSANRHLNHAVEFVLQGPNVGDRVSWLNSDMAE
jgi:hypothetical protein